MTELLCLMPESLVLLFRSALKLPSVRRYEITLW